MTTYTRPLGGGTPTTGQVVKAVHVNDPVDQIYDTILAGGITSDQIAAGAVDTSELATAAVTAAKMDGTLPDTSEMATSAAPTTDKQLANKKYVDDQIAAATVTDQASSGSDVAVANDQAWDTAVTISSFAAGSKDVLISGHVTVVGAGVGSSFEIGVFIGSTEKASHSFLANSGALGGASITWLEKSLAGTPDIHIKVKAQAGSSGTIKGTTNPSIVTAARLPSAS